MPSGGSWADMTRLLMINLPNRNHALFVDLRLGQCQALGFTQLVPNSEAADPHQRNTKHSMIVHLGV